MSDALININGDSVQVLEIILLTTVISLLPSALMMMTTLARYVISLSFLRSAMGTSQSPPNTVLIGIALFLTLLTMNPVLTRIQNEAFQPYVDGEIGQMEFIDRASVPLKDFMISNSRPSTLQMYCDLAHIEIEDATDAAQVRQLPMRIIIPTFMTCELRKAFEMGFLVYLPFLLIDIVVASTLMSMGMIMLPPAMISTPFKLLLFVSVNGWDLMFSTLIQGVQ